MRDNAQFVYKRTLYIYIFIFLSTPKGILTGQQAKKYGVGGELLLKIW